MTEERRSTSALMICLAALFALTALDLWTKDWAQGALAAPAQNVPLCAPDEHGRRHMQHIRTDKVVLVEGYLEFRYAENCGAAFGMLDKAPKWVRTGVFMTAGVVAVGALMWMFITGNGGRMFALSVPLIVSGALGNMVDRVRLGYVVDFIRFHINDGWEWPTFNVADSTITVGVVLLLLDGLLRQEPTGDAEPSGEKSAEPTG